MQDFTRWEEYYLIEKLDLNVPVKVVANNKMIWQATWEVNGVKFRFIAETDEFDYNIPEWGITFWNMSTPSIFSSGSTDLTGDVGVSSLKVFSGVASAFKKFIRAKKPEYFFFSASEPSRVRLYNRLANRPLGGHSRCHDSRYRCLDGGQAVWYIPDSLALSVHPALLDLP